MRYQDTTSYPLHRAFVINNLDSPQGVPFVREYLLTDRRLLLDAVTHYEEPDLWACEIAPYDTASRSREGTRPGSQGTSGEQAASKEPNRPTTPTTARR